MRAGGGNHLCICTDGDADRVGIIDETGRFIDQLQVFALLMVYLFEVRGMGGPVVKTVSMTSMADKLGAEFGAEVFEVPVGFKNIAPKMMESDAVLFADMIVRMGKPLSQILADLERRVGPHAYSRHDIHLARDTYDAERKRILDLLAGNQPAEVAGVKVARVRADDGFKFYLDDGSWVLLRASGTEPLVRVYSEAATNADVEARLNAIEDIIGLRAHA
jgi:phosphomannomutase